MSSRVTLIIPEAPVPTTARVAEQRKFAQGGLRLGVLDNAKGNADHLLRFLIEGVRAQVPVASVVSLRKPGPATGATREVLDQLAREADFVLSAMAD